MNRVRLSDEVWVALAECDMLASVTNEHAVSVLRGALLAIRAEITKPTTV